MDELFIYLRTAFAFTCLKCGTTQLVEGVHADLPEEQLAEIAAELGMPGAEGELIAQPKQVSCDCGARFTVANEDTDPADWWRDTPDAG